MLDIKTANNKIWITRPEAAAMLGVSPQTVSNYAARGILQEKKGKPYNWYIRKEVEQLATIPELTDIELQRQALLAEQAELQELRTTIQKQRDNARTAFLLAFGGRHKYARCKEVVQACIDTIFAEGDRIAMFLKTEGLNIDAILLTHGQNA